MSSPVSLGDILNSILEGIKATINAIATAIQNNAETIGEIVVVAGLTYAVWRFGSRIFGGLRGWFRGFW